MRGRRAYVLDALGYGSIRLYYIYIPLTPSDHQLRRQILGRVSHLLETCVGSRQQLVGPCLTQGAWPLPGGVPPLCAEARKRRPGGLAPAWDPRWWSQVTSQHTDPSYRHSMHHSEGARDAGRGPKWVRHKPRKAASCTSHACAPGQNHQLLQRTPPVVIVPP